MSDTKVSMDSLLEAAVIQPLSSSDVIEGMITSVKKHEIWVDLGQHGMGLVVRREIGYGNDVEVGQVVPVSVIEPDMDGGFSLVSLRKAAKDKGWDELERQFKDGETLEVSAYDANRGGLLVQYEGVRGFLPVSQLSAEHYPRVTGADKDEILQRLNVLIKKPIKARILDIDRKQNKLIFSEKEAIREDMKETIKQLSVGDSVKGTITGVVDFGAFVNVDGIEGLIHISEISWDRVEDPNEYVKVGQIVDAKIIAIDKDRLSLSLKQLQEDPWIKDVEKFKKDDTVEGVVTRITPFGAFIQLSPAVEALVHVSELGDGDGADPEKIFKLNEKKSFKILEVDKEARKIALSLKR
jgi:small subunit ribosomal protein S1